MSLSINGVPIISLLQQPSLYPGYVLLELVSLSKWLNQTLYLINSSLDGYLVVLGLVLSLTSIGVGYQLGSLTESHGTSSIKKDEPSSPSQEQESEQNDEEDNLEDDGIPDGDLAAVSAGFLEPCKMVRFSLILARRCSCFIENCSEQVLVVRTDLKLSSGSIAAQLSDRHLS